MTNRREFLHYAGYGLTAALAPSFSSAATNKRKKILVLGGTRFLGPVIVTELVRNGYDVTLFNRGQTNPDLFPQLPRILGDRETEDGSGLAQLRKDRQVWDWVVDTWRGSSKAVEDTARILAGRTQQYQYVSTVSVYDKWDRVGIREDEPLNPLPAEAESIITDNRYAIRKTFGELVLRRLMPDNSVMFRSHGLRGYPNSAPRHEPYWQVKIERGGNLVLPAEAEYYQVTDMISLARFMIHAGEQKLNGPYNVAYAPMRFADFINHIVETTESKVKLHWLPEEFLVENDVRLIRTTPPGRYRFSVDRALAHGMQNRSLDELLADQLLGYHDRNPLADFEFGKPETSTILTARELEILELWRQLNS
ncbi:MAG: hypothetical protein AAF431_03825 [Pseudomonadota bacterium]